MEPTRRVTVAAVQAAPVFLDRDATIEKVARLAKEAAANGAGLVVFPETFVPAYPDWVWRTTPWADGAWYERLYDQSVDVPGPAADALGAIARDSGAYLSIGVNERDAGTLYNTNLYFAPDGSLLGKHRKLMPTGGERLVWGQGDGSGLEVFDTPFGRLGGLTCWENYMPLARAALYAEAIDVYLAPTWDNSDVWVPTLRHIAKEGRVYVVGVNFCVRGSDVPRDLPRADEIYGGDDDWLARGNTTIVGPEGEILAGPLVEEEGIVYAEVDADHARKVRRQFDSVGHYARPDVLRLIVDRGARFASVSSGAMTDTDEGWDVEVTTHVAASPERIWPIVSDFGGHTQLAGSGEVREIRMDGPLAEGTTFESDVATGEVGSFVARCVIEAVDEPRRLGWVSRPPLDPGETGDHQIEVHWTFEMTLAGEGTDVRHAVWIPRPKLGADELAAFLERTDRLTTVRAGMTRTLENLKATAEQPE